MPETAPAETKPALLTADELAAELRVSRSWVYEAARTGQIPCLRVGSLKRFVLADVITTLKGNAPAKVASLVTPLR